jgi:predicted flavoprotein YhiN
MGHEIARSLGHSIIQPVPSLFTFDAKDLVKDGGLFHGLSGVAVPLVRLSLVVTDEMMISASGKEQSITEQTETETAIAAMKRKKKKPTIISQEGPLLITHHGVSGPAALRLSAFAAREFSSVGYKCEVKVNFCPKWAEEQNAPKSSSSESILMDALWEMTRLLPKRQVSTGCPLFMNGMDAPSKAGDLTKTVPIIPKRLWSALVAHSDIPLTMTWGDASKSMIRSLANNLTAFPLRVTSKGIFKDEFVTAGGVQLSEVQMSNMQSKVKPGLFMCGEVLDVDGVTGGFNFMGCWSTGFVAGEGAAKFCYDLDAEQEQVGSN